MVTKSIQKVLFCCLFMLAFKGLAQEFTPFTRTYPSGENFRYQTNIRGDMTFIANSIVNRRDTDANPDIEPEDAYNNLNTDASFNPASNRDPETGGFFNVNDFKDMQYIRVDPDPTLFSSSSATLAIPDPSCSRIRYAGLYWSATYPSATANGFYDGFTYNPNTVPVGQGRQTDFNQVKLRVPGGNYVDIIADEVLYDGFNSTDPDMRANSPYACYADVTSLITALSNPEGEYTVANIRSVTGSLTPGGGAAGGWTLVLVYENPTLPGKLITTFDGFAWVRNTNTVDILYDGFNTIPVGPVNAHIGAATLEGDFRIAGDGMEIQASSSSGPTVVNEINGNLDPNNFFNSDITLNGAVTTNRTPNSANTLGYDTDMFQLRNTSNSVIPNGETSATFTFSTNGDQYYPFFNSFNIEIIEPNIILEKKVEDIGGNDITGQGVNLGQVLDYVLSFQNIGNDHGDQYTIRDILPINVTLDEASFVLPPGMAPPTYDAATRTVLFTVPNDLIEQGDPIYSIRMRVQVAENCFDFIDACTDLIQNLAYSTYQGVINDNVITDDPSVTDFDNCGFIVPGATNFLLDDLSDCNFTRTVELCGTTTILDAGDNFDSYVWVRDDNGNNQLDSTDTVLNDGDPDNDPSTIVVNQVGTYIVDKIIADPCKGFKEIIIVEPFGSGTVPDPIIAYYNDVNSDADPSNDLAGEIVSCSVDGDELLKLFLCGLGDTKQLQVNILDAQSLSWERLDESSCAAAADDCANKNLACTWNQEATGNNFTLTNAGKYRLIVTYRNGCINRSYFDVSQNLLDIQYTKEDIVCTSDGNITITNLGTNYGYQLVDADTNAILIPFSANNGPSFDFGPGENGGYIVEVTQLDTSGAPISGACIFSTPEIGILDRNVSYAVNVTNAGCTGLGSVNIQVNNANADYEYEIRLDDGSNGGLGTLLDNETAQPDNNFTFSNLNAGDYIAIARTDDGCEYSEQVTIINDNNLELEARVSQHITCREGNIQMDSNGGRTPHTYAIWSYVDPSGNNPNISYASVSDIPPSEYQTSVIFDILNPGEYTFVVVDRKNCFAFSNTVTIEFRPAAEFDPTSITDVLCFGDSTGVIQFNLVDDNGYQLTYYLYDATGFNENNYNYADAIATNASGFFPGLAAGDYAIVINQRKGSASCDYFAYYTVSTPTSALDADAVLIQDYTCSQDGIIEAQNVTGGTAPYEYSIDGINFVSGPGAEQFSGLTDGTYTITVRDAANCTFPTPSITIDPRNEPSDLTFVATQPLCPALTSDVTVTVVDGNSPFTYEIVAPAANAFNNGNNNTFTDLSPGTYTFRVTDDKNCQIEETFRITPVVPITVNAQLDNNVTCFGLSDGRVTFNVGDFTSSYTYAINGPVTFSGSAETTASLQRTNLAEGTYTITVTDDATNCVATADVTVAGPPAALVISDLDVTDQRCSSTGTVPGSVVITVTDGWGGYEYELEDPLGGITGPQATNSFTGLTDTSGAYTVTVRDAGGCEVTGTFTLSPAIAPVLEVTANSLCYDSTTGLTLTANVTSGGEAPFQYRLNGGAYQTDTDFTGLSAGSYTVEVIDNKNCTATANIDVFPTLTASADLIKDLDCSASPDAEISITITGGNPTFTYEVFRNGTSVQASTTVASIPFSYFTTTAGSYQFTITDSESCTVTTNEIVVSPNTPPTVNEVLTDPLCATSADGAVELQITGGLAPYQIVFDGSAPSTQTTYTGLSAGVTYAYTVTDAKGCLISDSVVLTAPAALLPGTIDVVTDYRCDTTSAVIQAINYSGGTPGYSFSLDGVSFQGSDTFNTGITAGTYTITVRDANGCTERTPPVTIEPLNPPSDLTFSQTAPVCPAIVADVSLTVVDGTAPFNFAIIAPAANAVDNGTNATFTGLTPGSYTFRVTDAKGCIIEDNYTVNDIPQVEVLSQVSRNESCFGATDGEFTFLVSDFTSTYSYIVENSASTVIQSQNNINLTSPIPVTGLGADTYTVTVTDDTTNCTAVTTTIITGPTGGPLDFTFTSTPVTCLENSTIAVTATGGYDSYEYQLENTVGPAIVYAYQGNNTFANVPAGTYTIYVRDSGGCIVDKPITIDSAETPTISLGTSDFCYDATDQTSLVINVTDGIAPYSYSINSGGQTTALGNPFTIANLTPGTYAIQVTDAFGCVSNTLTETIEPELSASAVLTKDLDCSASPDAIIDVTISNGYTPYANYEVSTDGGSTWGPPIAIVGANFSFTTATSGTYDFRIADARGCTVIVQRTVNPIDNPDITSLVQTTDILCNGDAGATIQVNLANTQGVAPFTISVVNTSTTTNYGNQTSGLPAGTYEVTVTDAKSCTDTETIVISEPDAIVYDVALVPITCDSSTGTNPGSITVENVAGGTAEFTYNLTGNNGYSATYSTTSGGEDHTFAILEFGIYEVDVVDSNGCSERTTNIIASPPDDLDIDVSATTADCVSGGTAVVTVSTAILGTNYEFGILDSFAIPYASTYFPPDTAGGPTRTFTGLTPGITYTFVVHDMTTNCYYFETADAPIDSPSNLTSTLDAVNNITCTGSADGSVTFSFDNYASDATSVSYEIFNSQSNVSTAINGTVGVNPPAVGSGVTVSDVGPLPYGVYYILFSEVGGTYGGCSVASAEFTITESTNELAVTATVDKNDNCNLNAGQISAIAQFGTTPYEYQLTSSTDPAPTSATWAGGTANVFNVEGGDYIVYAKDAHGCIRFYAVSVPTDPSPEISVVTIDQCTEGEGNFSVAITLDVAGIVPHSIQIDGGALQAAPGLNVAGDVLTISNLSSGPHTFEIKDVNGCGEIETITIYPPLNIRADINEDENCVPANSGEVSVTAGGGSGNYSFAQVVPAGPTNTTGDFTGLTHSVAYTFEVTDTTTNCTLPVTITLPAPAVPTFTLEPTDVSCSGGNDGTITVILNSGNIDSPYEYSLDGGTTRQPSNVFAGLTQGTYNVTVISEKGCQDTQSTDVNEPTPLSVSAAASDFGCDDSTSTVTVNVDDATPGNPSGTAPYAYSFDGGANFLTDNTYQIAYGSPDIIVVVRDANGCTDTVTVPIPVREEVTATINRIQPIDCSNLEEIIEIVASNGSGSYTYTELPSGTVVADPSNIVLTAPGTYIYQVLDTATNCSITVEHVVAPYDLIDVTATVVSDATCSDGSNGTISATITGYTGTFDYQVLDSAGTPIAGTLGSDNATTDPYTFTVANTFPAGIYSVQVIETAFPECRDTSNQVTIDAPEPLALQLVSNTNSNCNEPNAVVTVQASGGTAPYTYGASVSGGGVPATFPFDSTIELDPTVSTAWDIYVQDANGCLIALPLAVTVGTDTVPDITLAIDDECAEQGSFGITVSLDATDFGIAPYTMSMNGSAFQSIAAFPYTYTGLTAGAYTIEIRDANGCGELENITIEPELGISAMVVAQPTCATGDGIIEFTVTGGSGTFTSELLRSDLTPTGIAATGNQFTGVPFGDYIVRITDTALGTPNCIADAPISLEEPTPVTLLTTDKTDVSCAGAADGTIRINMEPSSAGVNDNPPYIFEITDGTSTFTQDNGLFTGLAPGTWDITVTSNRNCTATDQIIINEPTALAATITDVVPFSCDANNAQQTAMIEVTITTGTGTPDYFYSVNGDPFRPTGGLVFTYDALTAGTYDIVVRDANGCSIPLPTQVIDPLNDFTPNVTLVSAITCVGPEEVLITVADDGNPHLYTFELLPVGNTTGIQIASTDDSANYELLSVGSYTFRVTDTATGCYVDTAPYEIAPYDLIEATAQAVEPVICYGDTNGSFSLNVSGYAGTYSYEVFDTTDASVLGPINSDTSVNPRIISGLSGGNYYVRVTETDPTSTMCFDDTNVFTIVSPDMPLTELTEPLANVTCDNDRGELSVDPSGGYAPYDITLTNITTGQVYPTVIDTQAHVFTGLSEGDYRVDVVDANNCAISNDYPAILVRPTPVTANAIPLLTNLACFGDTNGTVTAVNVMNGSGSYEYQLNYYDVTGTLIEFTSGEQISDTFTGLGAGIYSITVTDGWNCDFETNQVTITEPTGVMASLIRTSPLTCETQAELELTASGGTAPYSYSIDGVNFIPMSGGNTHTFNVDAGSYRYYVQDSFNCVSVLSNEITEDPIEELLLENPTAVMIACNGEATGSISTSASGGLGNYRYSLFTDAALTNNYYGVGNFQATGQFNGLPANTYYVAVTSEDCTAPAQEVVISELPAVDFDAITTMVTCVGEDDGSITITNNGGGTGVYQYAISDPNGTDLKQFENTNVFTDLEGSVTGTVYRIIAQDTNGCFEEIVVTIFEPEPLELLTTAAAEFCEGDENGTITLNISGGTAPYRAALNSTNEADFVAVTDGFVFMDLSPGFYEIRLRDANNCEQPAIAEVETGPNLNATVLPIFECDSNRVINYLNITLEDESILGDVLYALDSDDLADAQLNPDFRNSAPGDHYVTIFHGMCSKSYPFTIADYLPVNLILTNPNINEITATATDGLAPYTFFFNDVNNGDDNTYMITRSGTYEVRVVDQNGCEDIQMIEMEFIDIEIPNFFTPDGDGLNDRWLPQNIEGWPEIIIKIYDRYGRVVEDDVVNRNGWDGTYNDSALPTGDYWYIIKLNGENDTREFVGHFTLYR